MIKIIKLISCGELFLPEDVGIHIIITAKTDYVHSNIFEESFPIISESKEKKKKDKKWIKWVQVLFGFILWHINHCWLFNAKSSLYILNIWFLNIFFRHTQLNDQTVLLMIQFTISLVWFGTGHWHSG